MNRKTVYAYLSLIQAIQNSGLTPNIYKNNERVGVIAGSGINRIRFIKSSSYKKKSKKKTNHISPYSIVKNMPSGISACLSTILQLHGISYSISSACTTSAHCIGNAYELIKNGHQDIIFSGGSEELTDDLICGFDAMRVLSSRYNSIPKKSSRVYDKNRDGFVVSEGSGMIVLEELNHAVLRKAYIYAEIVGYGFASDGYDMVIPSESGSIRCMKMALRYFNGSIDYLNTHGTSTKKGDIVELNAIRKVFLRNTYPIISSTKSITGHSLGASGVHELIYTLIMMNNNFIAPSINIETLDPYAENMNILTKIKKQKIFSAMSNSFGFGGTNVSLVLKKW